MVLPASSHSSTPTPSIHLPEPPPPAVPQEAESAPETRTSTSPRSTHGDAAQRRLLLGPSSASASHAVTLPQLLRSMVEGPYGEEIRQHAPALREAAEEFERATPERRERLVALLSEALGPHLEEMASAREQREAQAEVTPEAVMEAIRREFGASQGESSTRITEIQDQPPAPEQGVKTHETRAGKSTDLVVREPESDRIETLASRSGGTVGRQHAANATTREQAMHYPGMHLTPQQRAIADGAFNTYVAPIIARMDAEVSGEQLQQARLACAHKAVQLSAAGAGSFADVDRAIGGMLLHNKIVLATLGGAAMVSVGYSGGTWGALVGMIPKLKEEGWSYALQGALGGLIISTADKVMSSGFAAVTNRNLYAGPMEDVAVVKSKKPTLKRIGVTSGVVAGLGTFGKNITLRTMATQLAAPDRKKMAIWDVAADTLGTLATGPSGRLFSNYRLNSLTERASLFFQTDVANQYRTYTGTTPAEALGTAIMKNIGAFAKGAGTSLTLPTSYVSALWCMGWMTALQSTHGALEKGFQSPDDPNFHGRTEAFLHTLASSTLMGVLVGGVVTMGILGLFDPKKAPPAPPSAAPALDDAGMESEVRDNAEMQALPASSSHTDHRAPRIEGPRIQEIE